MNLNSIVNDVETEAKSIETAVVKDAAALTAELASLTAKFNQLQAALQTAVETINKVAAQVKILADAMSATPTK